MSKKKWVLSACAVVVGLAIIGSATSGGSDKSTSAAPAVESTHGGESTPVAPVSPKVHGDVTKSILVDGDQEAISRVAFARVWCRWNDGNVEVHVLVKNRMAAHVTVHLSPSYRLAAAGLHGDGVGDIRDIGVNASEWRDYSTTLGKPEGVDGAPRITVCQPELEGIDLG